MNKKHSEGTKEALAVFRQWLGKIPSVDRVEVHIPNHIEVRTYVNDASAEEYEAIYALELKLIDQFPDIPFYFQTRDRYYD